jgi:hypothetical protein
MTVVTGSEENDKNNLVTLESEKASFFIEPP